MRLALIAAALLTSGAAQAAEHYACADAEDEITVSFNYDHAAGEPFSEIEMQLTDDFGMATNPDHPDHDGEVVTAHYKGKDFIGAELRVGAMAPLPVMQIRLVTVSEGAHMLVTGGVSVLGGGIWTVTCTLAN